MVDCEVDTQKGESEMPKAIIAKRWYTRGDSVWCVINKGKTYPFGDGDLGLQAAKQALAHWDDDWFDVDHLLDRDPAFDCTGVKA
jgi:hypothetical protein